MKYIYIFFSMLLLSFFISACSDNDEESPSQHQNSAKQSNNNDRSDDQEDNNDNQGETSNNDGKDTEDIDSFMPKGVTKIPNTKQEILNFPVGQYGGVEKYNDKEKEINETLSKLPALKEANDPKKIDQYFLALLGFFARDYPNPKDLLNQWETKKFGSPDVKDPRFKLKDHFNVEVLLDASGSMAADAGGKTRMELAKQSIKKFAKSLPDKANLGLRVYGHKGSSSDSDKKLSCNSSELIYDVQPYKKKKLTNSLKKFGPSPFNVVRKKFYWVQSFKIPVSFS